MADQRRGVLIYAMNFAPEFAGVGKYTGELAEMIADMGYAVTVVTTPPHYPGWAVRVPSRNAYATDVRGHLEVLRCPLPLPREGAMRGLWRLLAPAGFAFTSAPVALWRMVRDRPAVVLCIEPTIAVAPVALLGALFTGARTMLHVQDLEVDAAFAVGHLSGPGWLRSAALACERWLLRRFDRVVTISDAMAASLAGKGVAKDRLSVVRNWVDLDRFGVLPRSDAYRRELRLPTDAFLVLYSGNIGAKQGLDQLLDAATLLRDRTDIHVAIAGEGPARADLVARYGTLPNVSFLPFQPAERLNAFLASADLHALIQGTGAADLVLPSKLGAMLASGRPVVATADADTELGRFLADQADVVPPADPQALAARIATVAATPEAERRMAPRATVEALSAVGARSAFADLFAGLTAR